jgi:DNA repair photolyase
LYDFTDADAWDGPYKVVECKKALSPSKLPDIDYALNPYGGCAHGCVYCYAPEVTHSSWNEWRIVRVKSNVAERLGKELSYVDGVIGIGTTTDPYQYAESRFRLTEQCLHILKEKDCRVHIHTKSDLILRDVDLIQEMKSTVGITVTNIDDRASKITEPGAPLPSRRFLALKNLSEAGIDTYALVGPVLNLLEGRERDFVDAVLSTGTKKIYIDSLNSRPLLSERLSKMNIVGSSAALEKIRRLASKDGLWVYDVFNRF